MSADKPPDETSAGRVLLNAMHPRLLLAQANRYPVVIKQLVQAWLILIYPVWAFSVVFSAVVYFAVYYTVYYTVRVLIWPVNAWMNRNRKA